MKNIIIERWKEDNSIKRIIRKPNKVSDDKLAEIVDDWNEDEKNKTSHQIIDIDNQTIYCEIIDFILKNRTKTIGDIVDEIKTLVGEIDSVKDDLNHISDTMYDAKRDCERLLEKIGDLVENDDDND